MIVVDEFRDGNVPAAHDNLGFLKRCEAQFSKGTKFRIRSDGAAYTHDLMGYANKNGHKFAISADLSQGLLRFIRALPDEEWQRLYKITDKGREETKKEWIELSFSTAGLSQAEIRERIREYRYIVMTSFRTHGVIDYKKSDFARCLIIVSILYHFVHL